MHLLTYRMRGREEDRIGVLDVAGKKVYPLEQFGLEFCDMNRLIAETDRAGLRSVARDIATGEAEGIPVGKTRKRPPIPFPRQDIICLGINYKAHGEEAVRFKANSFGGDRTCAIYFSKRVGEATADGDSIPLYNGFVDSLDYEAELAVVIGREARRVKREQAFDYVFGYTILNDVSARNLQTRHKQWYMGKGLDGFSPMGPCIVTEDAFERPPKLAIRCYVNGELRQNSNTEHLIFDIPHVIAELSTGITLKAGTIISMGTPAGVGMGFDPPRFLKTGDIVECEVEGIGVLSNVVK